MSNRILETTIKVSGERKNVENVLTHLTEKYVCTVSPVMDTRDGSHVYIRILGVVE